MQKLLWLALSYNVPINPSKVRVYVWRKLRDLGAEYLRQGVALLPHSQQNLQKFSYLAQKIRQMGGEAQILELRFLEAAFEQTMTGRFKKQIEDEYKELLGDCAVVLRKIKASGDSQEHDKLLRLAKRYRKTKARDYFLSGMASGEIEAGLNELFDSVRAMAGDFGKQLRSLLDI